MPINNNQKTEIINLYKKQLMSFVDISEIYNVSATRIRQIVYERLGEVDFNIIRRRKKKMNAMKWMNRYRDDEEYRKKCLKRYYDKK